MCYRSQQCVRKGSLTCLPVAAFALVLVLVGARDVCANSLAEHAVVRTLYQKPPFQLHYSHHFEADIDEASSDVATNEFRASAIVPVYRWNSGAFALVGSYSLDVFHLKNSDGTILENGDYELHQITLSMGFTQTLGERWALSVGVMPRISSDFRDDFDADMFFVEGRVEAGWAVSDSFSLRLGVAVHNRFGIYLPIPMLGCAYRPADSWFELKALLPKLIRASFHVTDYLDLEVFAGFDNNVWDINQENLGKQARYIRIKTGAGAKVRLWKGIYLRLAGGIHPLRMFDSYGTDSVEDYTTRTDIAPFVETEILVNPRDWYD
jgi:hypothetical protein